MKRSISLIMLCALAACGGGGGASGPAPTGPSPTGASPTSPTLAPAPAAPSTVDNLSFAGMLNNVRVANSAAVVTFDARLGTAAQTHANDMLANNYFSHTGLNGSNAGDRIKAAGYNWQTYGENIAQGQRSEAEVLTAWTNSPGHHANDINPNFKDFGLGKAGTGSDTRWVLVLATER